MKRKKCCCFILLILTVVLVMSGLPSFAEAEVIYIEDLEEYYDTDKSNSPVKYASSLSSYYLSFEFYGTYCCLGEVDLSKYDTLTITYGCDVSAVLKNDDGTDSFYFALTTTGAVQDAETGNFLESTNMIGKVEVPTPYQNWGADELDIHIESDYKGEVYLASFNLVEGHNITISDIYFWNQNAQDKPTEEPTSGNKETKAPATEIPKATPKATATSILQETKAPGKNSEKLPVIPIIIGVVALAAVITVVIIVMKKKK